MKLIVNSESRKSRSKLSRSTLLLTSSAAVVFAFISFFLSLPQASLAVSSEAIEDWRPMSLVWTGRFLMIGWVLAFRSVNRTASALKNESINRVLLSVGTLTFLLSLSYVTVSKRIASALEPQWPQRISSNALVLKVKFTNELDCAACARSIESVLRKQKGLEKAEINPRKSDGVVWLNPEKTSKSTVLEVLELNHFPATEVK